MERYLTKKSMPGRGLKLLESAAMIAGFALFAGCIAATLLVVVKALPLGMLGWQNFLLLIPALLLVLALNSLGERIRARKHAQVIVSRLMQAGGAVQADQAEAAIGVRKAVATALTLVEKGYLTDVRLEKGMLMLGEAAAELPEEKPVVQLFHDREV